MSSRLTKTTILIVVAEKTLRRLLEYRLSKQYDVRTASNGAEALERIDKEIPNLIISDVMMPRIDGFALQGELQKHKDTHAIPFIFLTAKADEQSHRKGMRTGVDDYITKPFDIEQLLSRIERMLARTQIFQEQLDAKIGQDFSQKLMPKKMPHVDGYQLFFHSSPVQHGGGDLFDWIESEPGVFFITIGDVMGYGAEAKVFAIGFLVYFRNVLHSLLNESKSPADVMWRMNAMLIEDEFMQETYASLLILRWEPSKNQITYVNAGHCRPVLMTQDGPILISNSDSLPGLKFNAEYEDTTIHLSQESAIVFYTNGLTFQRHQDGEIIGEQRLLDIIPEAYYSVNPIDVLLRSTLRRSKEAFFTDDVLIFWMQRDFLSRNLNNKKQQFQTEKKWDFFISHAWEDKEDAARPLAIALKQEGYKVWYDEFSIQVGDSINRKINHGLANSRYGIVILSEHFFRKEWTQKELDGLMSRESDGLKIILPVLHKMDADDIRKYSPILADRFAISLEDGIDYVVAKISESAG